MKVDPWRSGCLVFGNIRFVRIFAGFPGVLGRRHQTTVVLSTHQFSVLSLAVSSETLEVAPQLLCSDTESLFGFPLIPKLVTSNDLEWLFHVKFCYFFVPVDLELLSLGFENSCVNTDTCRPMLSA